MTSISKQSHDSLRKKVRKISIKGKITRFTEKIGVPGIKVFFQTLKTTKLHDESLGAIYTRRDGSFIRIYQENNSPTLFQKKIRFNIRLEDILGNEIYSSKESWEFRDKLNISIKLDDDCLENHLKNLSMWNSDGEPIMEPSIILAFISVIFLISGLTRTR